MSSPGKILLVCDVPPSTNYTAGLVLDRLCAFLPRGSLACYAVEAKGLDPRLGGSLDGVPFRCARKPHESYGNVRPRPVGLLASLASEVVRGPFHDQRLLDDIARFAAEFRPTAVWVVLQGQTMIRLARPLAARLGVPLYTLVWDPPQWWMRSNGVNPWSEASVLREFGRALKASAGCAVASSAMADEYTRVHGVRSVPLIASLDANVAVAPADAPGSDGTLRVGMAGQVYATDAWEALLRALDGVSWRVGGRTVVLAVLGRSLSMATSAARNVEFLGWRSQRETIRILSKMDVLYCPYWFDRDFDVEARLSFPSKLPTYLAAGRPVLLHGPAYASPASFVRQKDVGMLCGSLDPAVIVASLASTVADGDRYREMAANAHRAFLDCFTSTTMRRAFAEFIQWPLDALAPVLHEDHARS